MKRILLFGLYITLGVALGICVTIVSQDAVHQFTAQLQGDVDMPPPLIRCVNEIDRTNWIQFESKTYGFGFFYPSTYQVKEDDNQIMLSRIDAPLPSITFTKIKQTLFSETAKVNYALAGWKVADRQNLVISTPYFSSDDAETLTSTYLFARDFQFNNYSSALTMIKAVITDSPQNPTFKAAHTAGLADIEDALTEAEQILSTVRFLSYSEIYGPAGYTGSADGH